VQDVISAQILTLAFVWITKCSNVTTTRENLHCHNI